MINMQTLLERFENPGCEYRSLPFWGWNTRLDEEEIRRQIRSMHKAGIGGFFMHSRDGLETEYMSDEWMSCIRAAVNEAEELGMQAWLYDEDRWPSGTAGGTITAKFGDASRCKGFTLEVSELKQLEPDDSELLALYAAKIADMNIYSLRRIGEGDTVGEGERLLIARLETSGKCDWFNNEAPPDNLNPLSVQRFIEATHERYKRELGARLGTDKTVPGIFTDEPSLHDRHAAFPKNRGWIPWTYGFGDYFSERRGYDALDTLPYLYFNGSLSTKIRHDYWRTVSECYCESYSGTIGTWCEENKIAYTGHFLQEDKLGLSARVNGSIMPHYKHQTVPGIDLLCEQCNEYMTVKQCTSVSHQYRRPQVLSEAFGCTGWGFTFEAQKWMSDWQLALGVNRLAKHMALYTLKGSAKRDYPPSFNYNTTWWQHARILEDYTARISSALTGGRPLRDILVLHPQSTAWSRLGCNPYGNPLRREERDVPAINLYGDRFNKLLEYLSGIHYDYDLGDEQLMEQDGAVKAGRIAIAHADYPVLIMPPVDTLLESTRKLIDEFLQQGGKLIALTPLPAMIEGEKNTGIAGLFENQNCTVLNCHTELEATLEGLLPRRISIADKFGHEDTAILCLMQETDEGTVVFLCNNDRERAHDITVSISGCESLQRLNPLNGEACEQMHCRGKLETIMLPADSALYLMNSPNISTRKNDIPCIKPSGEEAFFASFSDECRVKRNMPNALTLDRCKWHFEGGPKSETGEVWQAQAELRKQLDMRQIYYNGIVQRYRWINAPHPADNTKVFLTFSFESSFAAENVQLALEGAAQFEITLNGTRTCNKATGWFLDRQIDTVALPPLKIGENVIELCCNYKNSTELEDMYLLGDFGVDNARRIIPENPYIRTGDWTTQGYPHYAGSLFYEYSLNNEIPVDKRIVLRLEKFAAITTAVTVNGDKYDAPWRAACNLDITKSLLPTQNRIIVEIAASPRNLMGPFHCAEGKPANTNDMTFRTTGSSYVEGYRLEPYGLFAPPRLYCTNE